MPPPPRRRPSGCLTALVAIVVAVVVSLLIPKALQAIDDADPPAAAPPDLCAAIGPAHFEKSVPNGVPVSASTYSAGSDTACDYRTNNSPPSRYGRVSVVDTG
ncbi:hypothetical protein ACQP1O_35110 [Nocardia sp. CA-151230]|uniref:hypothetical protein n=1 Tax=Nocardia sp. CA-151230 TaxID=3239982 RepID=UPI003D942B00